MERSYIHFYILYPGPVLQRTESNSRDCSLQRYRLSPQKTFVYVHFGTFRHSLRSVPTLLRFTPIRQSTSSQRQARVSIVTLFLPECLNRVELRSPDPKIWGHNHQPTFGVGLQSLFGESIKTRLVEDIRFPFRSHFPRRRSVTSGCGCLDSLFSRVDHLSILVVTLSGIVGDFDSFHYLSQMRSSQ